MFFKKNKDTVNVKGVFASGEAVSDEIISDALIGDYSEPFLAREADKKEERTLSIKTDKCRKTRIIEGVLLYATAPVISLALFFAFVAFCGIYPFGDRMMASYDLLAQIVPYAEHFFDVIEGKSSLFYSFSIAGGADVFGTLAYCMVSPFSFLFFVMGKGNAVYTVPFILAAKIACISLSATFFIRKMFPKINVVVIPVLAVLYTYSGYFHVANTYINWLDFMIYLPLAIWGFRVFRKTGKYIWFSVFLACNIYACFSIACFSLLIIYLILFFYVVFCVKKQYRRNAITKICLSLILTVALALPIMLPSFMAYICSGRNTGLFSNLNKKLSADHLYYKFSYVLCDVVLFILSLFYVAFCDKKQPFNKFLLVAVALVLAPVCIDEICLLLNAGSYMSYSLRFGFLNSCLKLYIACLAVENAGNLKEAAFGKTGVKKNIVSVLTCALALIACGLTLYVIDDLLTKGEDSFLFTLPFMKEGTALYDMFKEADFCRSFSSKFAHSLGGLEVIGILFIVFGVSVSVIAILNRFNVMNLRFAAATVAVIGLMQAGFACYHMVAGNRNTMITYDRINEALDEIKKEESDLTQFRIKDYENRVTADAPFTLHYRAYSVFSSVTDDTNFGIKRFFDYDGNGINTIKTRRGNVFADALMGYKYAYSSGSIYPSYWERFAETDNFKVYKNKYVFPTAFYFPKGELNLKDCKTDADRYDELYKFLGGEGSLTVRFKPDSVSFDESENVYTVRIRASGVRGDRFVSVCFPDDMKVEYCASGIFTESDKKTFTSPYKTSTTYSSGGSATTTYTLKCSDERFNKELIENSMEYVVISEEKVGQLSETAHANAAKTTFGADSVTCEFNASNDGYIFLNYVNIKGWSATVNGRKTELYKDDYLNFLIAETKAGESEVKFVYSSPYVKYILIGVFVGALLAFAVIEAFRRYELIKSWLAKIADFSADALAVFVLGFGFIYPAVLFIVKCFKAVFKI